MKTRLRTVGRAIVLVIAAGLIVLTLLVEREAEYVTTTSGGVALRVRSSSIIPVATRVSATSSPWPWRRASDARG